MAWINPVPDGVYTRGFAPSSFWADGAMYADDALRKAHDTGNGSFSGSVYWPHFHAALDIAAAYGTPIYAPESGLVLDAQWGAPGTWANGGGWYLRVLVNDSCMYLLAHCSSLNVVPGQLVEKGQRVAAIGQTGVATGNHTHFWTRLGPRPYYDPSAFFYNPALILPGGIWAGDSRFAPENEQELPDTGLPSDPLRADGDPFPMRFRSEVAPDGDCLRRTLITHKPIRAAATVNSTVIRRFDQRRKLNFVGRIPKEDLPAAERPYGDVFITPIYDRSGHRFGYVKQVDLV